MLLMMSLMTREGGFPGFGPKPEERFAWAGLDGKDFNNDYGGTSRDWGSYPSAVH